MRLVIYFVYRHFYDDYEKVNGRFNDNNVVDDVDDAYDVVVDMVIRTEAQLKRQVGSSGPD